MVLFSLGDGCVSQMMSVSYYFHWLMGVSCYFHWVMGVSYYFSPGDGSGGAGREFVVHLFPGCIPDIR